MSDLKEQRLDLCLVYLRFFKTRSLSQFIVEKGKVRVNGKRVRKSSHKIRPSDTLVFPQGDEIRSIRLLSLLEKRESAPIAEACYEHISDFDLEQSQISA